MPSFKWKGIDWYGNIYTGVNFARSYDDLEKMLLIQEIGLLSANYVLRVSFFNKVSTSTKSKFFKELAILTESGIQLHKSLDIIASRAKTSLFGKIIEEIAFDVKEGASFFQSIARYPKVFDGLIIQMVQAGQDSGKMIESLKMLSIYLEKKDKFFRKLRAAILLPAITFILFIIIALIIFIGIIPAFSRVLNSSTERLPYSTQNLLKLSQFLINLNPFLIVMSVILIVIIFFRIIKSNKVKIYIDLIVLKIPFVGKVVKYSNISYFLQSISLLLSGGVHLSKALFLTKSNVKNLYMNKNFTQIFESVLRGKSLSEALANSYNFSYMHDLIEMAKVGEESGRLGFMLNQAALIYYDKLDELLTILMGVIQPILMIILGLMIAFLIFAVYLPIFNLPNIII